MWHIPTSSKYTWSRKQIPEVEWDTQEETQPLELPHRLAHICCQIPSLSPSLSYDQQCYQGFTGKLNGFMDTYRVLLVKALKLLIQLRIGRWVTDLCPTPTAFSVTQMGVRKSRRHILENRDPIQIWIWWWRNCNQTAEAKNKIMISFYGLRDRTFVIVKPSTTQVVWKGMQHTQKWFWYNVDVGKKLEKQNLENFMHSCIWTIMLPGRWDTCQKEVNHGDDIPTGKVHRFQKPP